MLVTTALTTVTHLADSGTHYVAAIDNPISGIVPDFTVFGAEFDTWWKKLFGGIWAVAIILALGWLVLAILDMRRATGNHVPGQVDEAKSRVTASAVSVGCLAAFGVIAGAIFTVFG